MERKNKSDELVEIPPRCLARFKLALSFRVWKHEDLCVDKLPCAIALAGQRLEFSASAATIAHGASGLYRLAVKELELLK